MNMATSDNKGFLYEGTINKNLKKYKLQKSTFVPAGADANAPDAMLTYNNKDNKVEVKLDLKVDFGQGSLDYNVEKEEWLLGGAKTASAQQMREFLTAIGVVDIVNKEWGPKGPPRKFTVPTNQYKKEDVDHDYKNFKDVFVNIPRTAVANYYNSKKTYYIQIGGFGLYHMGKDIAKLGTDEFKLQLKLRIRIKRGGSIPIYNYRFTTAIQAVNGSLKKTILDLDDISFLSALSARSKK
jgi:hypothetical protein